MLTITDYDFPLLAGTCGRDKQLAHVRTFLYGTFAENISNKKLCRYLRLRVPTTDCCGGKNYKSMTDEYPWQSHYDFPLTQIRRRFFADGPAQCIFQCAAVQLDLQNGERCALILADPHSKTSRLQLAFMQHIIGSGRGFICQDDQAHEFSERELRAIYSRAIRKSRFRDILYFLYLIEQCESWREFDSVLIEERMRQF